MTTRRDNTDKRRARLAAADAPDDDRDGRVCRATVGGAVMTRAATIPTSAGGAPPRMPCTAMIAMAGPVARLGEVP